MPKSKSEAERLAPQDADGKEQPVGALACPADEAERHLRAFIAAFVLPDARPRWLEMLIDRRSEWDSPLPKSHPNPRHLKMMHRVWNTFSLSAVDPRYRRKIPSGQRVAAVFEAEVGKGYGVYICPGAPAPRRAGCPPCKPANSCTKTMATPCSRSAQASRFCFSPIATASGCATSRSREFAFCPKERRRGGVRSTRRKSEPLVAGSFTRGAGRSIRVPVRYCGRKSEVGRP